MKIGPLCLTLITIFSLMGITEQASALRCEGKIIDNGKIRFLLVYWADANGYQVTDTSWDDHCNDDNFNWDTAKFYENYESLDDASSSRYFEFFCKLESLISDAVDNS